VGPHGSGGGSSIDEDGAPAFQWSQFTHPMLTLNASYRRWQLSQSSSVIFIATCSYSSFKDSNDKDESSDQTKIHFRSFDNQELPQIHQSKRRIGTQYGVSGLLGVGFKNKIFQNFLELVCIRRIGPLGYDVSDLLNMAYRTYWVRRIELLRYGVLGSLGTAYWATPVRCFVHLGYGVLAGSVLFLIFDQSIIYDVYTNVDTAYSSKSGNGLLIRQSCGTRIRFWKDIWVGETPLFTRYNRLYHLDQDKDCLIIDRINNGQWSWNWSRTNLGVRNLAYLCDMLNETGLTKISFPLLLMPTTWDKSIPRKVNVFMWRLSLDRLPHRLNLSSRGMDIPAISCPSCNANVESANHVFFECDIATDMWKLVFRWCDIPLFQASSWDSFNDWIISWHASKEKKHRFYVITTSVLWWLWRYRNSVTFSSQPLRKSDLFDNVRFSSFSWLHNRDHMKLSWNDWLMYPLSITRNGNG
ncbi:RNA-directed DNA polymerase, eukaryota, reverse transcriptase zinc-binding domain protein, partial [Tanacetum coccineum]